MPGIGSHLKVSHIDPRVCFGYELTNLSVRKSFLPIYIKSSRPSGGGGDGVGRKSVLSIEKSVLSIENLFYR